MSNHKYSNYVKFALAYLSSHDWIYNNRDRGCIESINGNFRIFDNHPSYEEIDNHLTMQYSFVEACIELLTK